MATDNVIAPEEVWLAEKEKCDVVVCIRERQDSGPPCKKRLLDVQKTDAEADTPITRSHVELKQNPQVILLFTTSDRLAKSPYFRVCLKEPWSKEEITVIGSIVQLPLETLLASFQGYRKCIEFLCSSQPCTPYMFSSPLEALDIYLASDHLLFKECAEACMDFLSAAPWSQEDKKIIYGTFANSSIIPSREVVARLGLSKDKPVSNLKDTLWDLYELCYYGQENGYLPCQLFSLIDSVLKDSLSDTSANIWSKKAISEFLYEAANDCVEAMKSFVKDDWMLVSRSFLGWLRMTELLLELTDGKESVMAVASDDDLCDLLLPALKAVTEKTYAPTRIEHAETWETIRQIVKLLIEIFKRVATAKVILSAGARTSLVKRWVSWFESIRTNEKICEPNDMPVLKAHIKTIIDTLGMYDGDLLSILAHASMRSEYFLEGAFKSWCFRLDQD